jgi:hypothetical protein
MALMKTGKLHIHTTYEKMKEKNPELYEIMMSDMNQALLSLYEEGFL